MQLQTAHRFNTVEYHRMAKSGVLRPDARVELLDGQIIDMSPIGPFHGAVVKRLSRILQMTAKGRWIVSTQDPVHLEEHSEPQPDVMVLRNRADDYAAAHPRAGDVFLLIEVSDWSLEYDRSEKLPLYAKAGIPEVWIVNLIDEQVEIHREPAFETYRSLTTVATTGNAMPASFPDLSIPVAELLKR